MPTSSRFAFPPYSPILANCLSVTPAPALCSLTDSPSLDEPLFARCVQHKIGAATRNRRSPPSRRSGCCCAMPAGAGAATLAFGGVGLGLAAAPFQGALVAAHGRQTGVVRMPSGYAENERTRRRFPEMQLARCRTRAQDTVACERCRNSMPGIPSETMRARGGRGGGGSLL